jgi:hypothetical protein
MDRGGYTNTCRAVPSGERRFIVNRFKLQAYCKEFPFFGEIIGDEIPDSVRIKRADENLLKFIPTYSLHLGSMGRTEMNERIYFVLHDGEVLHDVVVRSEEYSSNYSGDTPYSSDGETVLESIDRHGVAETLQYIVVESYYLDDWESQEYTEEHNVTIYKTPKNTTFGAEIQKARAQALAEVRVEADF